MATDATKQLRLPAVAGRFYPGEETELKRQVADLLERGRSGEPQPAVAAMVPHAGYVYSGAIAAQVLARISIPERVVVMAPNHTGRGSRVAVVSEGSFQIPGADLSVDRELAAAILAESPLAESDRRAHRDEHAVEVVLPFLAACQPAVKLVPIVLAGLSEQDAIEFGRALYRAISASGERVLVVASSDMSHFLDDERARAVDRQALAPLLEFDAGALYRTVTDNDISMCGYVPATAMLAYAREVKGDSESRPELVAYGTSGDAFGDRGRVVGYAGVVVWA